MNIEKFKEFLVNAKIKTYASEREGGEKVNPDGGKELNFSKGDFKYIDRYYGFNPFIGEEIVWFNDKFIWGMNYYGTVYNHVVSADIISVKQVYTFLQEAMRQVKKERPFRGPDNFKKGDFEYIDKSEGDVDNFKGSEIIFYKGQEVYRLDYHGGFNLRF